ncbi:hypothetical protein B0H14DRAFT_2578651 [Mycena olivaceomarginata]|nr:hypothetical protein B0H14DRAFT_2578651 [Mycena olivaceomarginata]
MAKFTVKGGLFRPTEFREHGSALACVPYTSEHITTYSALHWWRYDSSGPNSPSLGVQRVRAGQDERDEVRIEEDWGTYVCCGAVYKKEKRGEVGIVNSMGEEKNEQRKLARELDALRRGHPPNASLFSAIWPDGMGHGKIPAALPATSRWQAVDDHARFVRLSGHGQAVRSSLVKVEIENKLFFRFRIGQGETVEVWRRRAEDAGIRARAWNILYEDKAAQR